MKVRKILLISALSMTTAMMVSGLLQWAPARHTVRTAIARLMRGKVVSAQSLSTNSPTRLSGIGFRTRPLFKADGNGGRAGASPCLNAEGRATTQGCGPDSPPVRPSAMDDEFSTDAGLNTTKWTWLNQDGANTNILDSYLVIKAPPVPRYVIQGITQPLPKPPYQFIAKCSEPVLPADSRVSAIGLGLYETATTKLAILWLESPHEGVNMPVADAQKWVGNSFVGPITGLAQLPTTYVYLGVASDGATVSFGVSTDGRGWTLLGTDADTDPFTTAPDKVGIFLNNYGRTVSVAYGCDYFRRTG